MGTIGRVGGGRAMGEHATNKLLGDSQDRQVLVQGREPRAPVLNIMKICLFDKHENIRTKTWSVIASRRESE